MKADANGARLPAFSRSQPKLKPGLLGTNLMQMCFFYSIFSIGIILGKTTITNAV